MPDQGDEVRNDPVDQLAQQLRVAPDRIKKRPDAVEVLLLMGQGVLVKLTISYPRFYVSLSAEHLGLAHEPLGLTSSAELEEFVQLGRRSLIPKKLRDRINRIETKARECLYAVALDTPWKELGRFVPSQKYFEWLEANARIEQEFWELRDEIVEQYAGLVASVLRAHRNLALQSWDRLAMGAARVRSSTKSGLSGAARNSEGLEQDYLPLSEEALLLTASELRDIQARSESRQRFVEAYLSKIRSKMPSVEALKEGFKYTVDFNTIQLPSLLAKDISQADRIYQERALRDAEHRHKVEQLEAEHRAEMERIAAEGRAEAEVAYQRRLQQMEDDYQKEQLERERQRLAREKERLEITEQQRLLQRQQESDELQRRVQQDLIRRNWQRQQELVDGFYNGIVAQLNQSISNVCKAVLASLGKNSVMTGRSKLQINNLIKRMQALNIVEDAQIEDQITRLSAALEVKIEVEAADGTPYERIDTDHLDQVLQTIRSEADEVLVELGVAPLQRVPRGRSYGMVLPDEEEREESGQSAFARRSRRAQRVVGIDIEEDIPATTVVAKRGMRGSARRQPKRK